MKEKNDEFRCKRCGRKLKNSESQRIGYGKICASKEVIEFYEKNQLKMNLD